MFIYAILILLPALALAQPDLTKLETDLFNGLDGDSNGKVSQSESEAFFLGFDTNKDGEISQAELKTALDNLNPAFAGHEAALFALFDRNSDGQVNKADIDAAFALADANADGSIDKAEFSVIFQTVVTTVG